MKGMILAAGLGTRLRPLTNRIPKPAIPFLNVPLLLWNEYLIRELKLAETVVNTHHLPKQVTELFKLFESKKIIESFESRILGSGGGIWKAKKYLGEEDNFFACNGDNVILPKGRGLLKLFKEFHEKEKALATLLVIEHEGVGAQFRGLWAGDNNRIVGVSKQSQGVGTKGYHFVGLQMFSKRIFKYLPEGESNIIDDVLAKAIANGEKVLVFPADCIWYETGDEKSYLQASKDALEILWSRKSGFEREFLESVLKTFNPGVILPKSREPLVGAGTSVPQGAKLSGAVVLGSHVTLSNSARLKDSVVLDNASVTGDSNIENRLIF